MSTTKPKMAYNCGLSWTIMDCHGLFVQLDDGQTDRLTLVIATEKLCSFYFCHNPRVVLSQLLLGQKSKSKDRFEKLRIRRF